MNYYFFPIEMFVSWLPNILDWCSHNTDKHYFFDAGQIARIILNAIMVAEHDPGLSNKDKLAGLIKVSEKFMNQEALLECLEDINFFGQHPEIVQIIRAADSPAKYLVHKAQTMEYVGPTTPGRWLIFNPEDDINEFWQWWEEQITDCQCQFSNDIIINQHLMWAQAITSTFKSSYGLGKTGGEYLQDNIKNWLKNVTANNNFDLIDSAIKKLQNLEEPMQTAWYNSLHQALICTAQQKDYWRHNINQVIITHLPTDVSLLEDAFDIII